MRARVALVTINPTLDIILQGGNYSFSKKAFANSVRIAAGGSAVNVARGLRGLGSDYSIYTIFGGNAGRLAQDMLRQECVSFNCVDNVNDTRAAVIVMDSKTHMHVAPSPTIGNMVMRKFVHAWRAEIAACDIVLIGGSVPDQSAEFLCNELVQPLVKTGCRVVLDTRGDFASRACECVPEVFKMNTGDFREHDANRVSTREYLDAAVRLHRNGVALVTHYTRNYCYAVFDDELWRYPCFTRFSPRTFGRGDAFLAGLLHKLRDNDGMRQVISFANACAASFVDPVPIGNIAAEYLQCRLQDIGDGERLKRV